MTWLYPSVVATSVATFVLLLVYIWLWHEERKPFFGTWVCGWAIYLLRFLLVLLVLTLGKNSFLLVLIDGCILLSSYFLLHGTNRFLGKKTGQFWLYLIGIDLLLVSFVTFGGYSEFASSLMIFTVSGIMFVLNGYNLLISKCLKPFGRRLIGWTFIIWGLHKLDYPFLRPIESFAPWGYLLAALAALISAFGIILVYLQEAAARLKESEELLSNAMEGANLAFWSWNLKTNEMTYSFRCNQILGYSEIPQNADFLYSNLHPDDAEHVQAALDRHFSGDTSFYDAEMRIRKSNGSWLWVRVKGRVMERDTDRNPLRISGTMEDIDERMKTRDALRFSRNRYTELFQNNTSSVIIYKPVNNGRDFEIVDLNPAGEKNCEIRAEDVKGKRVTEVFPGVKDSGILESFRNVCKNGKAIHIPVTKYTDNRFDMWVENRIFPLKNGDIVAIFDNVTEKVRAECWSRMSTEILEILNGPAPSSKMIQSILDVIKDHLKLDATGIRIRRGNSFPYYESSGLCREFLDKENSLRLDKTGGEFSACICGKVITGSVNHPDFFSENGSFWTNSTSKILQCAGVKKLNCNPEFHCNLEGYESVAVIPLRSGSMIFGTLHLLDRSANRFYPELIHFIEEVASSIGVALHKEETEKALRKSEKRFRTIFENAPFGIFMADTQDLTLISVNKTFCEMISRQRNEVMEYPLQEFVAESDRKLLKDVIPNITSPDAEPVPAEFRLVKQGQSSIWVEALVTIIFDEEKKPLYLLGLCQDISEKRRLEDQVRQSRKMDAVGQLAGGIAHDFNNQLTGILGYADLLCKKINDKKLRKYAESIRTGAKRSSDLTGQLLAFSRKGQNRRTSVNIHMVIAEVISILERSIDKQIEIRKSLKADSPFVCGDPTQLQNALLNIAINARDAMPQGGELAVSTSYDSSGRNLEISIKDTGCGIPEDVQETIFEPFFTTKEEGKGTGMGLAAVYGIAKSHNGVIEVNSEVGTGTEFKLILPIEEERLADDKSDAGGSSYGNERCRILLADDEEIVRLLFKEFLEELGHSVILCSDGLEAVEEYKKQKDSIDLVFLDLIMPKQGGRETFLALKELNPEVKVIICSGYSVNSEVQFLLDHGAISFLKKPFYKEDLSRTISRVIKPSQQ